MLPIPIGNNLAIIILEISAEDNDPVNQQPYSEATECEKHSYP